MPLGKHKGWPLADVGHNAAYYAWFKGIAHAQIKGKTGGFQNQKPPG
jgi:hypothetical protein